MKQAITPAVTFTPLTKQIDFAAIPSFDVKKLYAVINITTNQIIYAVGLSLYGFGSIAGTVVTFLFDTTAMSAGDRLSIIYDSDSTTILSEQSGSWTTGRTWTLSSGTDSVSAAVSNFPASQAVTGPLTDAQLRATAVPVSGTFFQATQPISAASLPLPTGASTEATLALIKAKTDNLDVLLSTRTKPTDTQAISAASLPLPTGAATSANQTNASQKTQLVDGAGLVVGPNTTQPGVNALPIAVAATNFVVSTVNSSTAQLGAGATFTGTVENAFNQQSYSLLITSDQNGTLTIKQYIDAAGVFLAQSISFAVTAGVGFARSGVVNGNYISLNFTNNGASPTTTLNINMAYGTIPSATQLNNAPVAMVQNINASVANSSTANLASAATFTGISDDTLGVAAIQVNLFATQPCTVQVQQSTNGTNWDISDSYVVQANTGDGRTVQATASFFRVLVTNNGSIATTSLRLQSVLCPIADVLPRSLGPQLPSRSLSVTDAEAATFTAIGLDIAIGNNKSMLAIFNPAGSSYILKIRTIKIINSQQSAVTGIFAEFRLRRITALSAGTAITPRPRDTSDALAAGIVCVTNGTKTDAAGPIDLERYLWGTDELATGTLDVASNDHAQQILTPSFALAPNEKPITLRAGEGLDVRQLTNSTAGTFDVLIVFTQE